MSLPYQPQVPRQTPLKIRVRIVRSMGAFIVTACLMVLSSSIWLPAIGHWLAIPPTAHLPHVDAIVVHGGNEPRTQYGLELYQQGLAPQFWHLGYAISESRITMDVEHTVPSQAFLFLPSISTWSDGTDIASTIRARRVRSVIIITDWWHSRRALCSTEQQLQGYDVAISFAPSPSPASPANWWQNTDIRTHVEDELIKLGYYTIRYGLNPWGC